MDSYLFNHSFIHSFIANVVQYNLFTGVADVPPATTISSSSAFTTGGGGDGGGRGDEQEVFSAKDYSSLLDVDSLSKDSLSLNDAQTCDDLGPQFSPGQSVLRHNI